MDEKIFLLVCEGETDIYIFETLAEHFSTPQTQLTIKSLAPKKDVTSGIYPSHGYGDVLKWCIANRNRIQKLIDFLGANILFLQMDTDIAQQINPNCIQQNYSARQCCEEKLNQTLATTQEPPRCYYILPTQNTETWILASHNSLELDENANVIENYELITNTEQRLIALKYPSKKGKSNQSARKLNKTPADKYKKYGKLLTNRLTIARQRCAELNRLCWLLEQAI